MNDDTTPAQPGKTPYTCNEYREEMILAGLQRRLAQPDLPERERREIEEAIRHLETEMGF